MRVHKNSLVMLVAVRKCLTTVGNVLSHLTADERQTFLDFLAQEIEALSAQRVQQEGLAEVWLQANAHQEGVAQYSLQQMGLLPQEKTPFLGEE